MNSQLDQTVLICSGFTFFLFLAIHIFALRVLKKCSAPPLIIGSIITGGLLSLWIFWLLVGINDLSLFYSRASLAFACGVSLLIYMLLVFHYIAWIFGMGEAAIRIRLLFEIDKAHSGSVSLVNILERYNAEKILEVRLERLVTAGHVRLEGAFYKLNSPILLSQLWLIRFFKNLLGMET